MSVAALLSFICEFGEAVEFGAFRGRNGRAHSPHRQQQNDQRDWHGDDQRGHEIHCLDLACEDRLHRNHRQADDDDEQMSNADVGEHPEHTRIVEIDSNATAEPPHEHRYPNQPPQRRQNRRPQQRHHQRHPQVRQRLALFVQHIDNHRCGEDRAVKNTQATRDPDPAVRPRVAQLSARQRAISGFHRERQTLYVGGKHREQRPTDDVTDHHGVHPQPDERAVQQMQVVASEISNEQRYRTGRAEPECDRESQTPAAQHRRRPSPAIPETSPASRRARGPGVSKGRCCPAARRGARSQSRRTGRVRRAAARR